MTYSHGGKRSYENDIHILRIYLVHVLIVRLNNKYMYRVPYILAIFSFFLLVFYLTTSHTSETTSFISLVPASSVL